MKLHKFILGAACTLLINFTYAQAPKTVSVHFAFDKYDINAADMAALKNFKDTYPNIASIIIDAYADSTGTDDYNYRLSEKRCLAVKQALSYNESITEVLTKVTAHGEKDLLFQTNPENRVAIVGLNLKNKTVQQQLKAATPEVAAVPVKEAVYITPQVQEQPALKINTVAKIPSSKPKEFGDDLSGLTQELENSSEGQSIILTEIHFEQARHVLLKSSMPALNAMLNALKALPTLQIEIQGHMCCNDALTADGFDVDTKEFQLSYNRAKAVYDFFIQNGIDASRLTYKGYGTRNRLVNPEKKDEDRDKNRRVQFLITKK